MAQVEIRVTRNEWEWADKVREICCIDIVLIKQHGLVMNIGKWRRPRWW